jgi:hypothetical protein
MNNKLQCNWRTKLRRAAGRLLVAGTPVQDLLLRAKHLFVAATFTSTGTPTAAPSRLRLRKRPRSG